MRSQRDARGFRVFSAGVRSVGTCSVRIVMAIAVAAVTAGAGACGGAQSGSTGGATGGGAGGAAATNGIAATGGATGGAGAAAAGGSGGGGVDGGPAPPTECSDGIDNDGDGLVDWQRDLGCHGPADTSEAALARGQEDGSSTLDVGSASLVVFVSYLDAARAQTRLRYDARLGAPAINDYIRAGFGQ